MSAYLFTSESVSEGHPDKLADQISDAVLDAILAQDSAARVACETMVKTGVAIVAGEITTSAWVDLEDIATGDELSLRIVGPDEIDPKRNWISIDAPMARALLKKTIDDEVPVERPAGRAVFLVVDVRYSEIQEKS